jgi:hypothetical protein
MNHNMFSDAGQQQAMGFLIAQTAYIEPQVYRIKYPALNYAEFVPVNSALPEYTKSVTFFSVDMYGRADWLNMQSRDVPLADITRGKGEAAIETAGIGYRYNLEELGQAQMLPGTNLTTERATAARRAAEEKIHNVCMYGDPIKNWLGITNHTLPTVITAPRTWVADMGQTTPAISQILQDVNGALTNIWQSTLTVEMADTVLLPISAMSFLAITQLPNTTMNLLQWLKQNNMYTQTTGRPIVIQAVRGLDTAGASGNGRMIAYRRDPEALQVPIPMPFRFFPVWQTGPFVFDVPGAFRMGGLQWRLPATARYVDGVC